jgi:hypothetical protein
VAKEDLLLERSSASFGYAEAESEIATKLGRIRYIVQTTVVQKKTET